MFRPKHASDKRHLIITVHGIRTYGGWQERLESALKSSTSPREHAPMVMNYKYGYFSTLAFVSVVFRSLAIREFREHLARAMQMGWDRIDIVAHSFGTYIVAHALLGMRGRDLPRINTFILAGSVLSDRFNWDPLVPGRVERVINFCGVKDRVLLLSQLVPLLGMAGRIGFRGLTGAHLRNCFVDVDHSGYFATGGEPSDSFMREHWIPLLLTNEATHPPDGNIAPWSSPFELLLINNLRPLKVGVYSALVLLLLAIVLPWARSVHASRLMAREAAVVSLAEKLQTTDPLTAALLLTEHPDADLTLKDAIAFRVADEVPTSVLIGHTEAIQGVAFSPDERLVATASTDRTARIWRTDGTGPVVILNHDAAVSSVMFSIDGKNVLTTSFDGKVRIWNSEGAGLPSLVPIGDGVISATFSPDGRAVLAGSSLAYLWQRDGKSEPLPLIARTDGLVHSMLYPVLMAGRVFRNPSPAVFNRDGSVIVVPTDLGLDVWRSREAKLLRSIPIHKGGAVASSVAVSPDAGTIAAAWQSESTVTLFRLGSHGPVVLRGHEADVVTVAFHPDGNRILSASRDGTARVWDLKQGGVPILLPGESPLIGATLSPDGTTVLTWSDDRVARLRRADGRGRARELRGHSGPITEAVFSPRGEWVATASTDHTVRIWNTRTTGGSVVLLGHTGSVTSAHYSSDGVRIVTSSTDGTARVWRTDGFGSALVLRGHVASVTSATFSPDNSLIATTSMDGTARIWRSDGTPTPSVFGESRVSRFPSLREFMYSAAFSADGRRLLYGSGTLGVVVSTIDGTTPPRVLHWCVTAKNLQFAPDDTHALVICGGKAVIMNTLYRQGLVQLELEGEGKSSKDRSATWGAEFGPVDRVITFGSAGMQLWNVQAPRMPILSLRRSEYDPVTAATFSHDGKSIAVGSTEDGTIRVLSLDRIKEPVVLRGPLSSIDSLAFSPDDSQIVAGSDDGTARVWRTDGTGTPIVLRHDAAVTGATFSPDGKRVLTSSADFTARVWIVDPRLLLRHIRESTTACLSLDQRMVMLQESNRDAVVNWRSCEGKFDRLRR